MHRGSGALSAACKDRIPPIAFSGERSQPMRVVPLALGASHLTTPPSSAL